MLVALLSLTLALSQSYAPHNYSSRIWFAVGSVVQDWTLICDPDETSSAYAGPYGCIQYVGHGGEPMWCSEEGDLMMSWRMWVDGDPETGEPGGYNYTSPRHLYSIDYDANEKHCECLMGSADYWNVGGEDCNPDIAGTTKECCCGDDSDEFVIESGPLRACCNEAIAFVYESLPGVVNCSYDYFTVRGHVVEQMQNGSYRPAKNANVSIRSQRTTYTISQNMTDENGNFSIIVPAWEYVLSVQKTGYRTYVESVNFSSDMVFPLIRLQLDLDCREDCSRPQYDADFDRFELVCSPECDGFNDCAYNSSVFLADGRSIKYGCQDKGKGWRLSFNESHDVMCCNSGYVPSLQKTPANLEIGSGVRNAQTFYLGTYRYKDGRLYSAYIVLFTK